MVYNRRLTRKRCRQAPARGAGAARLPVPSLPVPSLALFHPLFYPCHPAVSAAAAPLALASSRGANLLVFAGAAPLPSLLSSLLRSKFILRCARAAATPPHYAMTFLAPIRSCKTLGRLVQPSGRSEGGRRGLVTHQPFHACDDAQMDHAVQRGAEHAQVPPPRFQTISRPARCSIAVRGGSTSAKSHPPGALLARCGILEPPSTASRLLCLHQAPMAPGKRACRPQVRAATHMASARAWGRARGPGSGLVRPRK